MGKYLKLFETHSQYTAFTQTEDFILPNVSYCKDQTDIVHYNPIVPPIQPLMVTYNVVDASNPTQLYYYNTDRQAIGVNMFKKVEIDGTEVSVTDLDAASGTYQLSAGEHTVAYTLKDPTIIGGVPIDETTVKFNAVFMGCNAITNVTIPNSVTSIGDRAFSSCQGLRSVTIPNSVTSIGKGAFIFCGGLESVTIGDGVTSIGSSAFMNCRSLTSITIPSGVTSIGERAFQDCNSLTSIVVDANNTTYDSRNNCNAIIQTSNNSLIIGCKGTVIPNTVTSIGQEAFVNCSGLTSIDIPDSVTSIGDRAFSSCQGLRSVTIPNSVTSIGGSAFQGCRGLTSIDIPDSVTSIGKSAFESCRGLTSVTIGSGVTSIGDYAFCGCPLDETSKAAIKAINRDATFCEGDEG